MTDKQAVIDALQRLPEDASIDEITEELRINSAIRRGSADIAAGRIKTQEEVELASADPILQLGTQPVCDEIEDAFANHDRYLYGTWSP